MSSNSTYVMLLWHTSLRMVLHGTKTYQASKEYDFSNHDVVCSQWCWINMTYTENPVESGTPSVSNLISCQMRHRLSCLHSGNSLLHHLIKLRFIRYVQHTLSLWIMNISTVQHRGLLLIEIEVFAHECTIQFNTENFYCGKLCKK